MLVIFRDYFDADL
jgi:hypothetical protein